jgi:hypothetical protein
MVTALHAQTKSGVIILVGEITAPTCVWQALAPMNRPQANYHLTRNCQTASPQATDTQVPNIAQVRETALGDLPSQKRLITVAYW